MNKVKEYLSQVKGFDVPLNAGLHKIYMSDLIKLMDGYYEWRIDNAENSSTEPQIEGFYCMDAEDLNEPSCEYPCDKCKNL